MIIEIDDNYSDEITVANLAESYISIKSMLKNSERWHEEDVAAWKELIPAMELVGGWYSTDFKAAIKKAKKNEKALTW